MNRKKNGDQKHDLKKAKTNSMKLDEQFIPLQFLNLEKQNSPKYSFYAVSLLEFTRNHTRNLSVSTEMSRLLATNNNYLE